METVLIKIKSKINHPNIDKARKTCPFYTVAYGNSKKNSRMVKEVKVIWRGDFELKIGEEYYFKGVFVNNRNQGGALEFQSSEVIKQQKAQLTFL